MLSKLPWETTRFPRYLIHPSYDRKDISFNGKILFVNSTKFHLVEDSSLIHKVGNPLKI